MDIRRVLNVWIANCENSRFLNHSGAKVAWYGLVVKLRSSLEHLDPLLVQGQEAFVKILAFIIV